MKTDDLIRSVASREIKRIGNDTERFGQVRNKARELARLVVTLRNLSNQKSGKLADFIKPESFSLIVTATKLVAGFSEDKCTFATPSLASKLGHSLKLCADILLAQAYESQDDSLLKKTQGYCKLHEVRWHEEVSSHATRTLQMKSLGKSKRLPLSQDVAKLASHLNSQAKLATDKLAKAEGTEELREAWVALSEVSLTQMLLFNRRRAGEVSKVKLEHVKQQATHDPDVLRSLSEFEKKLCEALTRIEVTWKRGRKVPILLTKQMKAAVDLLIAMRSSAGISATNQFLFACRKTDGHLRGCDTLRKYVASAALAQPANITSSLLRKQVATLSQLVSLKDNELDVLAGYMGHDIRIHREYYRLPYLHCLTIT